MFAVRAAVHHSPAKAKPPVAVHHTPSAPYYKVRAGDTLAAVAARTGISATRLRKLNPGLQSTALFLGEKIRLR